ncbi:MAG: hypothetical protein A3J28_01045 [Acidobacteria bacterium RIFCSPLOWO2_12_FULL_60_22]|nr:MAG: hypothetical protein A3J28_01045 [Acidobacteria bacterium RIFCSPLOWO2_12_FULL_60_22]
MTPCRRLFLLLALLAIGASAGWTYHPFGRYNTAVTPNTLIPARYDVSKLPNATISFYLTNQKPQALAPGDSVEALMSEIATAASTWNSVATSSLRVNFGGYTKQGAVIANPMGTVTFSSSIPPGAAAVGGPIFRVPSGTPEFLPIELSRIQLPTDMSRTNTSSAGFLTVLAHEMGHSLGAKHSHVAAGMYQTRLTSRARVLTEDDVALLSLLYPAPSFAFTTGAISGRVTTAAGQGASVVGVSAFSETVVIGAFTKPDGTFTIQGLPPGAYKLMVQPLMLGSSPSPDADNPGDPADLISLRTLNNQVVRINTDIDSAFFAGGGAATRDPGAAATFPVSAGQTTAGAAITIGSRGPLRLDVDDTVSFPLNVDRGSVLIWVPRGGRVLAFSYGKALNAPGLNVGFTNPELTLAPGSLRSFTTDPSEIFNTFAGYRVQAGSGAVPGSSSVIYTNGADTYFSPGHVRVVASDPPSILSISPAAGGTGTAVAIEGSNFTDFSQVYFDGVPARVSSRSATSLVVVAPPGAGGHAASVFVANSDGQGSEFLDTPPKFTYSSVPQPSLSISPTAAVPGQALTVRVTGANTNFQQGLTAIGFGSGDVVVDSITVENSASLVARVRVLSLVSSRTYSVTAVTGEEVAFLEDALTLGTQPPFTLVPFDGDIQTGAAGSLLPQPLVVSAEDSAGVPISGVTVTFTVALGGGSVSPVTAVTDSQGLAQTRMTLGPSAGIQIVLASADQFASTGILEIAGDSTSFTLRYARDGDTQTALSNSELPTPLTVTVSDNAGMPLPGIPVGWLVTAGGGSVRALAAVTDSSGKISASWTLGPVAGSQSVRAIPYFYYGISFYGFNGTAFTATAQAGSLTPSVPAAGILNGGGLTAQWRDFRLAPLPPSLEPT